MSIDFLNIRHLRAFKEVAQEQGVSAAADRVHLSQPAVTQAISGMEKHFQTTLFNRRHEGMFVTDAGAALLSRVQRLFNHIDDGADKAIRLATQNDRKPVIGFQNRVTASQLRAIAAIWEKGSFSLAARDIGISQPSIHRAARDLEKISGMTLFVTTRKGIELTPSAEIFTRAVKLAAAELRQGYDEISWIKGKDSANIVVGSMPLSRTSILPEAIHQLLGKGGAIQVRTIDGPYGELLRGLRHGDLDVLVGALRSPNPADDVVQEPLVSDPLAIIVGANHPLAGQTDLKLEDTLSYPWIAPPKTTPAGSYLYDVLEIGQLPTTPVCIVSSSLVLVRGMLARGDYVTVMSLHQVATEWAQGLVVPLDIDLPNSARPIGLTYRLGWAPTPTQKHFFELIRSAAKNLSDEPIPKLNN